MKNKAVFLDRDGTINIDFGYTHKIKDLEIFPNAMEGLKLLQDSGYKRIIITNQSGIARGYFTEEDYHTFMEEMYTRLGKEGINFNGEYFCPHHPDDNCNCRKPKTGMLEQAAEDFKLNLEKCWFVGDFKTDIECGKNAGCKTIHVLTGNRQKTAIPEADYVTKDLLEASKIIIKNEQSKI